MGLKLRDAGEELILLEGPSIGCYVYIDAYSRSSSVSLVFLDEILERTDGRATIKRHATVIWPRGKSYILFPYTLEEGGISGFYKANCRNVRIR